MNAPRKPELAGRQRFSVEQARELIARTPAEILAADVPGASGDHGSDYGYAWGRLKPLVVDLIAIIDELTGGAS